MKLKQRPEDFSVTESWRFDPDPRGAWFVYLMDKQKLSTFEAVERISSRAGVQPGVWWLWTWTSMSMACRN